jgi:hypothetical protein
VTLVCATTTSIGNGNEPRPASVFARSVREAAGNEAAGNEAAGNEASRSGPNKPMVPTATDRLGDHATGSLRRHIGQPLGRSGDGQAQRATSSAATTADDNGQRLRAT